MDAHAPRAKPGARLVGRGLAPRRVTTKCVTSKLKFVRAFVRHRAARTRPQENISRQKRKAAVVLVEAAAAGREGVVVVGSVGDSVDARRRIQKEHAGLT